MRAQASADNVVQEYQDFVYSVSHDLNTPLRHVKEFTRLLIGMRINALNEEEQQYVEFLEKSLSKIDKMQEALITISRLGTRAAQHRKTDCNFIVSQVMEDLNDVITSSRAKIETEKLPSVIVEPSQFHLLFFHLIDNALKFREISVSTEVSIKASKEKDFLVFQISDNGIGIPEQYHEEVFRIFHRLDPDKSAGVGAGLTIAQKVIHRHGGNIWLEARKGGGTIVFFSLPLALCV